VPTPRRSRSVLTISSRSWVRQWWRQTSPDGTTSDESTATIGTATTAAVPIAVQAQSEDPAGARASTRGLLVAGPIRQPRGRGLELAGRRHVGVVLLELAPLGDDRVHRGLGVGRELE